MDKALDTRDLIATRTSAPLGFRDDINGLRALAVLGVVAFHADRAWVPGGFTGVDVFFVISGFLISRIVMRECAAGHFSLAAFYARRARRILPAMLAVVAFVWILGWYRAAPVEFRDIGGAVLGNSYFTVNFWLLRLAGVGGYFGPDSATKPLLHLWSLSIEEQFYLAWSVLLLALFKLRASLLARRHRADFRRLAGRLRHCDPERSDRRVLSALDPRGGSSRSAPCLRIARSFCLPFCPIRRAAPPISASASGWR